MSQAFWLEVVFFSKRILLNTQETNENLNNIINEYLQMINGDSN